MQFDAVWASLAFGALGCLLLLACRRRGGKDLPKAMRRLVVVEPNADLALARVVVEEEAPLPVLKRGQVLIKVCAASINPSDYGAWRARSAKGEYPLPTGQECSGVVVATGGGVSTLGLLGRRVAAFPGSGTYADYVACSAWRREALESRPLCIPTSTREDACCAAISRSHCTRSPCSSRGNRSAALIFTLTEVFTLKASHTEVFTQRHNPVPSH